VWCDTTLLFESCWNPFQCMLSWLYCMCFSYCVICLDKRNNHRHLRKYRILDVFSFMVSSVLFLLMCVIFSFTFHLNWCLKLFSVATTVRSNLMGGKGCSYYSVTSVHALGRSLCQWLSLLLSVTFTVNCQSRCLSHPFGCCAVALLLSIVLHGNCY